MLKRRKFGDAVDPALAPVDLPLNSVSYESGEVTQGWETAGCQLGQDITVEIIGGSLVEWVNRQQEQLDQHAAAIANLYELHAKAHLTKVRHVSSLVLLVATRESCRETTSTRFTESDPGVKEAAAVLGVEPEDFITAAECILTRRRGAEAFHPDDVEQLVKEMAALITPALERMAKWECIIVKNYAAIKAAFTASSYA